MTTRVCIEEGCEIPAAIRSQRCGWHRMARLPVVEQDAAAQRRRARNEARPGYVFVARQRGQAPAGTKWCAGCQGLVPDWYSTGTYCRAHARLVGRSGAVARKYGLTAKEYDDLLELQGGRCAICRRRPRSRALAVDHDHRTGQVRGLCCQRCNHDLLGAAGDDVQILRSAVRYLETPPTSGQWVPLDALVDVPPPPF